VHFVRVDDRDGLRRIWCRVYADVRHDLARLVRCLEAFKSNVLATLELDEVLDAVIKKISISSR
jgi:hypothetical protein